MTRSPELRVQKVDRRPEGPELRIAFRRANALEVATVRLLPGGRVSEVWIGDDVWLNDPDRTQPLTRDPGLIGQLARKAEEAVVLMRAA